jgi:hypothetical protein
VHYDTETARFRPPAPPIGFVSSLTATSAGGGAFPLTEAGDRPIPAFAKAASSLERGGFLALTVRGRKVDGVAEALAATYPVAAVDLNALFLRELHELVDEKGTKWASVLTADAMLSRDRRLSPGLASYLRVTWKRVAQRISEAAAPGQVLFVHDADLLGRYWDDGGHDLLVGLQAAARRSAEQPHGLWLLCPGDTERETPRLGGHIVEVLGEHETAVLDGHAVNRLKGQAA